MSENQESEVKGKFKSSDEEFSDEINIELSNNEKFVKLEEEEIAKVKEFYDSRL
jgi:hypothetical protein